MDYALSLNYSKLNNHVDHIYSTDIEIAISSSYIELKIEIDDESRLEKKLSEMISVFPLYTFHLYVAAFQEH